MQYKLDFSQKLDVLVPSVTGAPVGIVVARPLYAWQPSTWPAAPATVDEDFVKTLKKIFEESILGEINNVIEDAKARAGGLQHRGHVVAIALMCALDAISSYGYGRKNGKQIPPFVRAHFPRDCHPHADELRRLYRNAMVHSWNLFEVSITPGDEKIAAAGGVISFGLQNFFEALKEGTEHFLHRLEFDTKLQTW